jgi:hypothetical protein
MCARARVMCTDLENELRWLRVDDCGLLSRRYGLVLVLRLIRVLRAQCLLLNVAPVGGRIDFGRQKNLK